MSSILDALDKVATPTVGAKGMEDSDTIQGVRLLGFDALEEAHAGRDPSKGDKLSYGTRGSDIENKIATSVLDDLDRIAIKGTGYYGRPLGVAEDKEGRNLNAAIVSKGVGDVARRDPSKYNTYDTARDTFNQESKIPGTDAYNTLKEFEEVGRKNTDSGLGRSLMGDNVLRTIKQPLVGGSFRRGVDQTQGMLYGFGQALSSKFGIDAAEEWMDEGRVRNLIEAAANPPKFATTDDIHSLGDVGGFIVEKAVETLPNLAVTLAGGTVGLLGRAAIGKAFLSSTTAFRAGGVGGAYATQTGEYFNDLVAEGVSPDDAAGSSLVAGVPGALLEFAPLGLAISKLAKLTGGTSKGIKNQLKQLMGTVGTTSLAEGATEYAQTAIGQLNKKYHNPDYDLFSEEATSERNQAAIAGAAGGGGLTVTAGGAKVGLDAVGAMYQQHKSSVKDAPKDAPKDVAGFVVYNRDGTVESVVPTTPQTHSELRGEYAAKYFDVLDVNSYRMAQTVAAQDLKDLEVDSTEVKDSDTPTVTKEPNAPDEPTGPTPPSTKEGTEVKEPTKVEETPEPKVTVEPGAEVFTKKEEEELASLLSEVVPSETSKTPVSESTEKLQDAPTEIVSVSNLTSSTSNRRIAARTDVENNRILIDKAEVQRTFNAKAWTVPKLKGVIGYPSDAFRTVDEWLHFLVAHEQAHFTEANGLRPKGYKRENHANRIAYIAIIGARDKKASKPKGAKAEPKKVKPKEVKAKVEPKVEASKKTTEEVESKKLPDTESTPTVTPIQYIKGSIKKALSQGLKGVLFVDSFIQGKVSRPSPETELVPSKEQETKFSLLTDITETVKNIEFAAKALSNNFKKIVLPLKGKEAFADDIITDPTLLIRQLVDGKPLFTDEDMRIISIASMQWLTYRSSGTLNQSKEDVQRGLGLDSKPTAAQYAKLRSLGMLLPTVADEIGGVIVRALKIKGKPDALATLDAAMVRALGMHSLSTLAATGSITISELSIADRTQLFPKGTTTTVPSGVTNFVKVAHVVDSEGLEQHTKAMQARVEKHTGKGLIYDMLLGVDSSVVYPSFTKPNTKDMPESIISKSGIKYPVGSKQHSALLKLSQQEYTYNDIYKLFSSDKGFDEFILDLSGTNIDYSKIHEERREDLRSQLAKAQLDLTNLKTFAEDVTPSWKSFFIPYVPWANIRMGMQPVINPQGSKLHRLLVSLKGQSFKVNSKVKGKNSNYQRFQTAIAFHLGNDEKNSPSDNLKVFNAAKKALNVSKPPSIKGATKFLKSIDAFNYEGLAAYVELHKFKSAKGGTFTSNISLEFDGKTNGPAYGLLHSPVATSSSHEGWLAKVGVFTEDTNSSLHARNKSSHDVYQTVVKSLLSKGMLTPKLTALLGKQTEGGIVTKAWRDFMKQPVTLYMYGAGKGSTLKEFTNSISEILYTQAEESGDTTSAITTKKFGSKSVAEMAVPVKELNDVFSEVETLLKPIRDFYSVVNTATVLQVGIYAKIAETVHKANPLATKAERAALDNQLAVYAPSLSGMVGQVVFGKTELVRRHGSNVTIKNLIMKGNRTTKSLTSSLTSKVVADPGASTVPNLVHSFDSASIIGTVNSTDTPVLNLHDALEGSADRMSEVGQLLNKQFIDGVFDYSVIDDVIQSLNGTLSLLTQNQQKEVILAHKISVRGQDGKSVLKSVGKLFTELGIVLHNQKAKLDASKVALSMQDLWVDQYVGDNGSAVYQRKAKEYKPKDVTLSSGKEDTSEIYTSEDDTSKLGILNVLESSSDVAPVTLGNYKSFKSLTALNVTTTDIPKHAMSMSIKHASIVAGALEGLIKLGIPKSVIDKIDLFYVYPDGEGHTNAEFKTDSTGKKYVGFEWSFLESAVKDRARAGKVLQALLLHELAHSIDPYVHSESRSSSFDAESILSTITMRSPSGSSKNPIVNELLGATGDIGSVLSYPLGSLVNGNRDNGLYVAELYAQLKVLHLLTPELLQKELPLSYKLMEDISNGSKTDTFSEALHPNFRRDTDNKQSGKPKGSDAKGTRGAGHRRGRPTVEERETVDEGGKDFVNPSREKALSVAVRQAMSRRGHKLWDGFRKVFYTLPWQMESFNIPGADRFLAEFYHKSRTKVTKSLSGKSQVFFDAVRNRTGEFQTQFDRIFKGMKDTDIHKEQASIVAAIASGKPLSPRGVKVKKLFDAMFDTISTEQAKMGMDKGDRIKKRDKYIPHIWDEVVVKEKKDTLYKLLDVYAPYADKDDIYQKLSTRGSSALFSDSPEFAVHPMAVIRDRDRSLDIPTHILIKHKLIRSDLGDIFTEYNHGVMKGLEWNSRFGGYTGSGEARHWSSSIRLARHISSMKALGATPDQVKLFSKGILALEGRLGLDMNDTMYKAQGWTLAVVNWLILPFALTAQLPDLVGPILRGDSGLKESWKGMQAAMRAMRGDPELLQSTAEWWGVVTEKNVQHAIQEQYEHGFMYEKAHRWNDRLFRYNGMQSFTRFTRLMALSMGEQAMLKWAKNNDTVNLESLGLTKKDVDVWVKNGKNKPRISLANNNEKKVIEALSLFVNEAILRPDATQRPIWASDPRFTLLWHLKQFMYSFQQVTMMQVGREAKRHADGGAYARAMVPILTVATTIPLGLLGLMLRDTIKYAFADEEPPERDFMDGLDRSGLYGVMQVFFDVKQQSDWDNFPLLGVSGPTISKVSDILTTKEWDNKLLKTLPVLNQMKVVKELIN